MLLYTIQFGCGSSSVNIMTAKYWVKKVIEYSWKNTDSVLWNAEIMCLAEKNP